MLSGVMKKYIFYALPAMPLALLGLPLYVYLPTFYAQDIGLGVFGVGIVLLLARVFDMFLDPVIGYVSDRYLPRKMLMFIGMLFLLCGFYFLTHPIMDAGYLWLLVFSILVYFGWSLVSIPYYALGSELGESYEQNTHYSSFRELFNIVGVLLALLIPYLFGIAQYPTQSLLLMNDIIFLLLPIILLVFFIKVNSQSIENKVNSYKEVYFSFINKLRTSKYLFGAFLLNSFANAIPASLFLLYIELVIGAKEQAGLLLLIYFFAGISALILWNYLASKTSKKTAWMFSMFNAIVFFSFVPFLGEGDIVYFMIITIFSGMSLGADMALPASMQADIAQDTSQTITDLSGTLFGFFAMLTKLSLALGVGVSFSILGFFEFTPVNPTEQSLFVLALLYGLLPVILKLIAIFVLSKYKEV